MKLIYSSISEYVYIYIIISYMYYILNSNNKNKFFLNNWVNSLEHNLFSDRPNNKKSSSGIQILQFIKSNDCCLQRWRLSNVLFTDITKVVHN
jgi:hypothetical protein